MLFPFFIFFFYDWRGGHFDGVHRTLLVTEAAADATGFIDDILIVIVFKLCFADGGLRANRHADAAVATGSAGGTLGAAMIHVGKLGDAGIKVFQGDAVPVDQLEQFDRIEAVFGGGLLEDRGLAIVGSVGVVHEETRIEAGAAQQVVESDRTAREKVRALVGQVTTQAGCSSRFNRGSQKSQYCV